MHIMKREMKDIKKTQLKEIKNIFQIKMLWIVLVIDLTLQRK